ncbi:hypothetical protein HYDPIDRAFT_155277 [Hydnomerulius pinastri MD-312]|uniref:Uncharacterized protein n=1 Tax=Hydnomerulius pinastri MD-312 TaxID=994086 RepID=A0A0C9VE24_9AGAM|nr:hypothetical protein HYDPIDRAFT_155277 [Hydnomerulius pinastri MD-312]
MPKQSAQRSALLTAAKAQLGIHPSARPSAVPDYYLNELQLLSAIKADYNFRVALQPSHAYGIVTCLEVPCAGTKVVLGPKHGLPDGGKQRGFGSLQNYLDHVRSVFHGRSNQERTMLVQRSASSKTGEAKAVSPGSMAPDTKPARLSLLAQLDANLDKISAHSALPLDSVDVKPVLPHASSKRVRSLAKPEPVESTIPRKRQSSTLVYLGVENHKTEDNVGTPPPSKRAKLDPVKSPLTLVDANATSTAHVAPPLVNRQASAHSASHMLLNQSMPQLSALQHGHAAFQTNLDRTGVALARTMPSSIGTRAMGAPPFHIPVIPKTEPDVKMFNLPVASGSNVRMEQTNYRRGYSDESDADMDGHMDGLVNPAWSDERFDSDGDFYGRGKDRFVGPVANPDDISKFLMAAGNAEQFDGNASVDKALEKLGLTGQYQLLPGMAISLMPHQTIGVAWTLEREKSSDKGGLLGDEMGLGKTVQIIALMVANASDDPICKTNLIVAPMALLDQWKLEIETKTTNGMKCLIYHGSSKPKNKKELMKYDVVLTTYHTLALEWPDLEAEQLAKEKLRKKKKDSFIVSDSDDDRKTRRKKRELGLLFQVTWYRVIIDEAQNIRNRRTRISRSVTDLESTYRWGLTGTPIVNGLVDAYALFRFIKLRPWYDWQEFNSHIARLEKKRPDLASSRLQAIFRLILLRRKKDSLLDGKKLIELPVKHIEMEKLEFSQEEREIYLMVEAKSQARFNRFLRAGTVLKNYHQVLVMLLRLRQICVHPALIQETCDALIASDQLSGERDLKAEMARATHLVSSDFVSKMKAKYKEAAKIRMRAEKESVDATIEGEECPVCMDAFTDAVVTACGHAFCRECVVNVLNTPFVQDPEDPNKYKGNEKPCPSCRSPVSADKIFVREAFEPTDDELSENSSSRRAAHDDSDVEMLEVSELIRHDRKGKGRATKRLRKKRYMMDSDDDDDDDMSDFIVENGEDEDEKDARRDLKKRLQKKRKMVIDSDDDFEEDEKDVIFGQASPDAVTSTGQVKMMSRFLPSTKMKKMMEHLLIWAQENADEKTIVVSQWTEALKLVSDYLTENQIGHVKYQGSMNRPERDKAVRAFMTKEKATVMLMSLKCGGVGLNLTRANRVISLDLGWSEAIESQAFDRVHRLGQQKEVFVQRLVIENTVEDRVLALQERKKNLADGSLGEGTGKKIGRLSVRELANLFGLDGRGNVL